MSSAASTWARAHWRAERRRLLGIALLVVVAGGVVLAATAGARRTATSLERLVARTSAADLQADLGPFDASLVEEIRALRSVAAVGSATIVFAVIDDVDVDVGLGLPRDAGVGGSVERGLLLEGRRPVPDRAEEVSLTESTADLLGAAVGDVVLVRTLTPDQVAAEEYFPPRGPTLDLTVVGITRGVDDMTGSADGVIIGTPALYDEVRGQVDEFTTLAFIRLAAGASADRLRADLEAVVGPDREYTLLPLDLRTKPARSTISALATGMAAFAAAAAVASAVVVGLAVVRHVLGARDDAEQLRALGMTGSQRRAALALSVLPVVLVAPVAAAVVAFAASGLAPIGLAARAEPEPGVRFDGPATVLGAVGVGAFLAAVAWSAAWWCTSRRPTAGATGRPSAAAALAARAGAPPSVVSGVGLALDRRPPAVPVGSAIAGVAVAVLGAVGVLVFAGSLDRLVDTPARWGIGWDITIDLTSDEADAVAADLVDDPALVAVARWDAGATTLDGRFVRAFGLTPLRGDVRYTVVEGRHPAGPGEVVIGARTADQHDLAIGDDVLLADPGGEGREGAVTVVGIAVFPQVDEGDFGDAVGLLGADFDELAFVPDLFNANQVVVTVDPGASVDATIARLRADHPDGLNNARPLRPSDIASLATVRSMPRWLLVFLGVLGTASLAHAVRSGSSRRRRDLVVLHALGMTRGQLRWRSIAQAATLAVAGLAVGVPVGLVAGRATWRAVATAVGVAADPAVPVAAIAGVVVVALLGAGLVAVLRRPPVVREPR